MANLAALRLLNRRVHGSKQSTLGTCAASLFERKSGLGQAGPESLCYSARKMDADRRGKALVLVDSEGY